MLSRVTKPIMKQLFGGDRQAETLSLLLACHQLPALLYAFPGLWRRTSPSTSRQCPIITTAGDYGAATGQTYQKPTARLDQGVHCDDADVCFWMPVVLLFRHYRRTVDGRLGNGRGQSVQHRCSSMAGTLMRAFRPPHRPPVSAPLA